MKKITILLLILVVLLGGCTIQYTANTVYEVPNYEDVKVEGSYKINTTTTVEGDYSIENTEYNFSETWSLDDSNVELTCGNELPIGSYVATTDDIGKNGTVITVWDETGNEMVDSNINPGHASSPYIYTYASVDFECKEGYTVLIMAEGMSEVVIRNSAEGQSSLAVPTTMTKEYDPLTGEEKSTTCTEDKKDPVEVECSTLPNHKDMEKEANSESLKTYNTTLTQKYDPLTGEKVESTCTKDAVEVECSTLPNLEEMNNLVDIEAPNQQTFTTNTDTLYYNNITNSYTAYTKVEDGEATEVENPEELVKFEELESNIQKQMNE